VPAVGFLPALPVRAAEGYALFVDVFLSRATRGTGSPTYSAALLASYSDSARCSRTTTPPTLPSPTGAFKIFSAPATTGGGPKRAEDCADC
jgi:hypothetical protein